MAAGALSRIIAERREPTAEELDALAGFPGWGATPELFDPTSAKYREEREYLQTIWSDAEWEQARRTILNAHYTHPQYVQAIWGAVQGLGLPDTARVLEPGCGKGNFITAAPEGVRMEGVELDATSARIAELLNPSATIHAQSFADFFLPHEGFDGAIGNVPFSQESLYDPAYNGARLSMHGHFIAKSLRMTKPGGVVALMSSRWLLDGNSDVARRELAKYGEFLGAVRQPAGAHQAEAGTEAIVDTLLFRRHLDDTNPTQSVEWMGTVPLTADNGETVRYSEYFAEHPEMVIGEMGTRLGRFGQELTVRHPAATDPDTMGTELRDRLEAIVDRAKANGKVWQAYETAITDRPVARVVQDAAAIVGRVFVGDDGAIMKNMPESAHPMSGLGKYRKEILALIDLRDAAVKLLEHEASTTEDTSELDADRAELNRLYDDYATAYGPLNRAEFTERLVDGEMQKRRVAPKAVAAFKEDPHYATLLALENFDDETQRATKTDVFEKRVVLARTEITSCETAEDAVAVSLDRVGHVDAGIVASLLDIPMAEVEERLGDLVFRDHVDEVRLVPARDYLSGNVRQKLREVEALLESHPHLERNAAALREVLPEPLTAEEIDVKLGVGWVHEDIYRAWLAEITGKDVVEYERIGGEIDFKIRGKISETNEAKWRVEGDRSTMSALQMIKKVINNSTVKMTYKTDADGPTLLDVAGTEAAQMRADEIREHFQDWLWRDADRAEQILREYNNRFNSMVLRDYSGYTMTFPGLAATFTPRPHQVAAVARMIHEPAVGLFHEVGAGKTAASVMGVMELRRLGLAQKPALVVPNHMLEQFSREAAALYPRARILTIGSDDVAKKGTKDGRAMFVARARTGDWDMVIITHGAFKRVGLGEAEAKFAEERLDDLRELHQQRLNSKVRSGSAKSLEQRLMREEEKLKKMLDMPHDAGVSFAETGIDYLVVDEAHEYKNLMVATSIPDLQKNRQSARAFDLDMKLWYLRDFLNRSHVVTLATGTPLPNQLSEMYVMQRYLRPDLLKEAGVYTLDEWAAQFTDQVTAVELKVEGGYQMKTRTKRFRNMPELLRLWHTPGDIRLSKDLNLPLPEFAVNNKGERAAENVIVPATQEQQEMIADLIARGEAVRKGGVPAEKDNLLAITSDGRLLALDGRLLGGQGPKEDEETKVSVAAQRIAKIYQANKDRVYPVVGADEAHPNTGALQLVFCDLGVPRAERWNAYDGLREALIEAGVPGELIRYMGEAATDADKAKLFAQCRDGEVAVLIGSTQRMGVGTNVQHRCVALHHLDAPWRPSDVTQREGRILRQGNQNPEVGIFRYATEGSFDSYMWSTLSRKAAFIDAVLTGSIHVREVEERSETSLSFAEMQAIASGDMRLLQKATLEGDVKKLENARRGYKRGVSSIEARRLALQQQIARADHDVSRLEQMVQHVVPTEGENFNARWGDMETRERANFGNALIQYVHDRSQHIKQHLNIQHDSYPMPLHTRLTVGGIEFRVQVKWNRVTPSDPLWVFRPAAVYDSLLEMEIPQSKLVASKPSDLTQRFERRVNRIPDEIESRREFVEEKTAEVQELSALENAPWKTQEEYDRLKSELQELTNQLEAEAQERDRDYVAQLTAFLRDGTPLFSPELSQAVQAGELRDEMDALRAIIVKPDTAAEEREAFAVQLETAIGRFASGEHQVALAGPSAVQVDPDYPAIGKVAQEARRMLHDDMSGPGWPSPPRPRY